jgi:transcriptional regulator with XRE-family HTH domain
MPHSGQRAVRMRGRNRMVGGSMEDFGVELRRRRVAAGLSLGQLADRIHYTKGYLSKVENGLKPAGPDLARLCDAALEAGGALTAMSARRVSGPSATTFPEPLPPLGAPTPAVRAAADLDETAADFRSVFDVLRGMGHRVSPLFLLDLLAAHTARVEELARGASDPARSRRLLVLAARFAEYTGWMAQESGDESAAARWTASAARLAEAGGDTDLVRYALVRGADLALYRNDAAQTIALAQQAQADPRVAARVRGLAAQREAQGHALAGDYDACMRTLDRAALWLAEDTPGTADGGPAIGTTSMTDPVAMITGWALHDLGRPEDAIAILDAAVPLIPAGAARSRARYGVRRALAHSAAGDVEQACALTVELLPVVRLADSATIRLELGLLARSLARWHANPQVRELYPSLTEALRSPTR